MTSLVDEALLKEKAARLSLEAAHRALQDGPSSRATPKRMGELQREYHSCRKKWMEAYAFTQNTIAKDLVRINSQARQELKK